MKVALLSNINLGSVYKEVGKQYEVLNAEGYGNVFEQMLNPNSAYSVFDPNITCIIIDIWEMVKFIQNESEAKNIVDEWFNTFQVNIDKGKIYYISDVDYRGYEYLATAYGTDGKLDIEYYWKEHLRKLSDLGNVYIIEYKRMIENIGREQFYSTKLWYLGKIPYSNSGQKVIANELINMIERYEHPIKKVLLLDLDNTLWGGVIGEEGIDKISLSEDGKGAIYKDFQRIIAKVKQAGVLLAIVSKNNEEDALEVIRNHPHMILKEEDFVTWKINWEQKHNNILEISKELNLGLDSFVFVDDNPAERELVKEFIPQVETPEFPKIIEELPRWGLEVYNKYFKSLVTTSEDRKKTEQYRLNKQRQMAYNEAASFDKFLEKLEIEVKPYKNEMSHLDRLSQLVMKTNQFNLTTKRYTREELYDMMINPKWDVYSFNVNDRFGDYGIVGVILIDKTEDIPKLDTFLMSCRIMGKWIENFFIDYVENQLLHENYQLLVAYYKETKKNQPVKEFYTGLGYKTINTNEYRIHLLEKPKRNYIIKGE